jgi:hypothetical protein
LTVNSCNCKPHSFKRNTGLPQSHRPVKNSNRLGELYEYNALSRDWITQIEFQKKFKVVPELENDAELFVTTFAPSISGNV